jgi:tRNA A-37 threonylcarbamoyl transferase component Bud32
MQGMKQAEIKETLTAIGDVIAHVLNPDHQQEDLVVESIKQSDSSTTLKAKLGDKIGFLKLFERGAVGKDAFARERKALELMIGEQVPRLLFVAEVEQVIMTSFIDGKPLLNTLKPENIGQTAEHMGQWFGRLSNKTPQVVHEGNWADYLNQYKSGFDGDILDQQRPILEQTRISRLQLSHNDNALANFILGKDKRLYGVDFEDSRMKPEGWDLVTAARSLFGQMPGDLPLIAGSLLRGYQLAAKDSALPENFDQVISATAFAQAVD